MHRSPFANGLPALLIVVTALLLAACAPRIYGVPEEHWEAMNPDERREAIRAWESVQLAREERRRAAEEAEAQRLAEREERVAAIRSGEAGLPGDLIRVSLRGGSMRLGGRDRAFQPLAFTLASGEVRRLEVESERRRGEIIAAYHDGLLLIDQPREDSTRGAGRIPWDTHWHRGARSRLDSDGPRRLRDVQVTVEVVPLPGHAGHPRGPGRGAR